MPTTPTYALPYPAPTEPADVPLDMQELCQRLETVLAGIAAVPTGVIAPFAGSAAPSGWLLCDGAAVSRTTYSALFAVLGTKYGSGDGSTTFNVPNLRGRVPAGLDAGQTEFNDRGKTGGVKTHTLAMAEMPSHSHRADGGGGGGGFSAAADRSLDHNHNPPWPGGVYYGPNGNNWQAVATTPIGATITGMPNTGYVNGSIDHLHAISPNGGGGAHPNMPPFQVTEYIVKV